MSALLPPPHHLPAVVTSHHHPPPKPCTHEQHPHSEQSRDRRLPQPRLTIVSMEVSKSIARGISLDCNNRGTMGDEGGDVTHSHSISVPKCSSLEGGPRAPASSIAWISAAVSGGRSSTSQYSVRWALDVDVLREVRIGRALSDDIERTYVTMTTPLLRTHFSNTWTGEAPMRLAAAAMGASTGPFGVRVIGLVKGFSRNVACTKIGPWKEGG
jgi:hypothetical protein